MKNDHFRQGINGRSEYWGLGGTIRGGVLRPVQGTIIRESEAGIANITLTQELSPIAGNMLSQIRTGVVTVFVPLQAMLEDAYGDSNELAGTADFARNMLKSDQTLFALSDNDSDTECVKAMGIEPMPVSGDMMVCEAFTSAHRVAVNYLRKRLYVDCASYSGTGISPALYSTSALDRLNGVLDPEDRVNGRVDFTGSIPVKGIGIGSTGDSSNSKTFNETGETTSTTANAWNSLEGSNTDNERRFTIAEDPDNVGFPSIWADLSGSAGISLTDMYQTERMDKLTRHMRQMVDANPVHGQEQALSWACGLSVNVGKQPFVMYENEQPFGTTYRRATDGANMDVTRTDGGHRFSYSVPVPKTEFGGVVVTFLYVKPDENLASQPYPFAAEGWKRQNFVADEMEVNPKPVYARQVDNTVDPADEEQTVMWVGNNWLKKRYVHYGWARDVDTSTVENKSAIWQMEVPMSVTPENLIYPATIDHYPFADQMGPASTYMIEAVYDLRTPTVFGERPVEELAIIEDADIFEDAE